MVPTQQQENLHAGIHKVERKKKIRNTTQGAIGFSLCFLSSYYYIVYQLYKASWRSNKKKGGKGGKTTTKYQEKEGENFAAAKGRK